MLGAHNLVRRNALLEFALAQCTVQGLVVEFGVYRGDSLRFIARHAAQPVHGFDSFEGLPEDWTHYQKHGRFSLRGKAPRFDESNISIHQGDFSATLPLFFETHWSGRDSSVDCDIYSSAPNAA